MSFCTFFLKIRPEKTSLFHFLLEGYDGIAVLSTFNRGQTTFFIIPLSKKAKIKGQNTMERICYFQVPAVLLYGGMALYETSKTVSTLFVYAAMAWFILLPLINIFIFDIDD